MAIEKSDVLDALSLFKDAADDVYASKNSGSGGGLPPVIRVTTTADTSVTATNGIDTFTAKTPADSNTVDIPVNSYATWKTSAQFNDINIARFVNVDACKIYSINLAPYLFGYRINKNESDPYACVEYLFDAKDMKPAKMVYESTETLTDEETGETSTGTTSAYFDYGDWKDLWFVTDNKPLMLKYDGTVDYYLNPNDYSFNEYGDFSAVADINYDGNAMAQFPLCWVKRYEDSEYLYEIVSNVKYDDTYKAYAHTDQNGVVKDYFYQSLFNGSVINQKLRSLSGTAYISSTLGFANAVSYAAANGDNWNLGSWSQRSLINTLLVLMSKSLDTQTSFGYGHAAGNNNNKPLASGTLADKGQFFGYNITGSQSKQVKVFHCESHWGDQLFWTQGLFSDSSSKFLVKMFPPYNNAGKNYTDTGVTAPSKGFISQMRCSEYGLLPIATGGSDTTYFCDQFTPGTSAYCATGWGVQHNTMAGAFGLSFYTKPSNNYYCSGILSYV